MCLFFETICIRNSEPQKLDLHNERLNRARFEILGIDNRIDISSLIDVPIELKSIPKVKCRIVYSEKIEEVSYEKYTPRTINKVKLLEYSGIDYRYKYCDRSVLENLYSNRGDADEILVSKNGYITDTSIHNISLFNGNEWHTPSEPLLRGVQRDYLLLKKLIVPKSIKATGLADYSRIKLFNSMNDWDECTELSTSDIIQI